MPLRAQRVLIADLTFHTISSRRINAPLKVFYVHDPNTYNAENNIEAPDQTPPTMHEKFQND